MRSTLPVWTITPKITIHAKIEYIYVSVCCVVPFSFISFSPGYFLNRLLLQCYTYRLFWISFLLLSFLSFALSYNVKRIGITNIILCSMALALSLFNLFSSLHLFHSLSLSLSFSFSSVLLSIQQQKKKKKIAGYLFFIECYCHAMEFIWFPADLI